MLCSFIFASCSSDDAPVEEPMEPEEEIVDPSNKVENVLLAADDFILGEEEGESRTAFTLDDATGLKFSWAAGDVLGVYPTDADQISFAIKSGAGQATAKFDGGAWALRSDKIYSAYYPYNLDNSNRTNAEIRFSYDGQQQTGNNSLAHLGTHDFMATQPTQAENGELTFKFKHLNSVALLRLTVPVAANFTTLTLRCDNQIFVKTGNLNLSGETYEYTVHEASNQQQMALSEVSSTQANQALNFYMMVPPVDMNGKMVYVILRSDDNKVYQALLESKTLIAGRIYLFTATLIDVTVTSTVSSPSFGTENATI